MYLANDSKVLMLTEDKKILIFDDQGYIIHDDTPCLSSPQYFVS